MELTSDIIDFVFPEEQEMHLFVVAGMGERMRCVINTVEKQKLKKVSFLTCESIFEYQEGLKKLIKEETFLKTVILLVDLGEGVDYHYIVSFIREAKVNNLSTIVMATLPYTAGKDRGNGDIETGLQFIKAETHMLLVIDETILHQKQNRGQVIDLHKEVDGILCQQVKDLVETVTELGIINLNMDELQEFITFSSKRAFYLCGYGTGEQRMQQAIENLHNSSVSSFSSHLAESSFLYMMIQYDEQGPLLEEMDVISPFILNLKGEVRWGVQHREDLSGGVRIFVFAKID